MQQLRRAVRIHHAILLVLWCLILACGSAGSGAAKRRSQGGGAETGSGGILSGSGGTSNPPLKVGEFEGGGATGDGEKFDLTTCEGAKAAQSTVGCDYYALHPLGFGNAGIPLRPRDEAGSCYAAYLANTSPHPVEIRVEYEGIAHEASKFARIPSGSGTNISYAPLPDGKLPSQEVAILFLSSVKTSSEPSVVACPPGIEVALPIAVYEQNDNSVMAGGTSGAFRISTSAPVVAYDFFPYGGGSTALASASLLIPTTRWGTNYMAVDGYQALDPWIAFVAAEDNTEIKITPTEDIAPADGVLSVARGQTGTFTLNRGQSLRIMQDKELNGSVIESTRPIGLWGGTNSICIPSIFEACDHAHQQLAPVRALGNEYAAVRYRNRYDGPEEAPPWRIMGVVPGTVLTYEPARPDGAPATLEQGELVRFLASGPFIVRSQDSAHPFYMSAHMTGCEYAAEKAGVSNYKDCRGDPEFVNVVPSAQFLSNYVFFTDPTYPETNLVVVRKKTDGSFHDVTLDCAGTLGGWQPIGNDYQYTRIDLVRHFFEKQGNCDNGRRTMDSKGPFGVTVWGWGSGETGGTSSQPFADGAFYSQAVSYAYPAGAGVAQVNEVVLPVVK